MEAGFSQIQSRMNTDDNITPVINKLSVKVALLIDHLPLVVLINCMTQQFLNNIHDSFADAIGHWFSAWPIG